MRYQGRLTQWNDEKGFGFITPNGGSERVFVHIQSFQSRHRRPAEDALLTYELQLDTNGRARAANVAFAGEARTAAAQQGDSALSMVLLGIFVIALAAACVRGALPFAVLGFYAVASLLAFVMYLWDKISAESGRWRTPETTLHLFALIGGWPGALLAQRRYRHKTRKVSFRRVFWMTVALNCTALGVIARAGLHTVFGGA